MTSSPMKITPIIQIHSDSLPKPTDFYHSLNTGSGIDDFLFSLKYYRAELSTVFDQLSSIVNTSATSHDGGLKIQYQNFSDLLYTFVKKFDMEKLRSMAHAIEKSDDLRNIVDVVNKIRILLKSLRGKLNFAPPKSLVQLQRIFEDMKGYELSQIDILLWGLTTISSDLKKQDVSRTNTSRNSDRVNDILLDELGLAHAREVIDGGRIELYGQGIFDINHQLLETEILMRVKDRKGDDMNPEDFLKFVKQVGYIEKLDGQIIDLTFRYISKNAIQGSISININPNTIQDEKFVEKIKTLVDTYDIDPKNIIIELLEYESSINVAHTNQVIQELRAIGFRIAIDDFPSGYNTLADISKFLDIDIIKIDGTKCVKEIFKVCSTCHAIQDCKRSIERTFGHDQRCVRKLTMENDLETLIFYLKFLKLQRPNVTFFAEMVENESVFNFLKQLDLISGYQGYFFERPKHLFEGRKENKFTGNNDETVVIGFNASSIKPEKTETSQQLPEVKKEVIQLYIEQLEAYSDGLLRFDRVFEIHDIAGSQLSDEMSSMLGEIIHFLGGDSLNFYFLDKEKKNFHVRSVFSASKSATTIRGNMSMQFPVAIDFMNRVDKKYVNLYKLLQKTPDSEKSGFQIASTAVPGLGDDIVVRINDRVYLGLDDSESAMDYSKDIQINFFLLFAMIVRNKVEAQFGKRDTGE